MSGSTSDSMGGRMRAAQRFGDMLAAAHRVDDLRNDRVTFATRAGYPPDPWQAAVLTSDAPRILLNCSRQSGKSTTVALLAAHLLTFTPRSLVLVVSPTERQSAETVRRVRDILAALNWPVPAVGDSVAHLELANAARLVALPGQSDTTVRGYSAPSLVLFDEAARVADALYFSVSPMVAVSGGRTLALSTPFGSRGWWYTACRGAQEAEARGEVPGWRYVEIPATGCPRISAAHLAEQQASMGTWWYEQEYLCRFLDNQSQAFSEAMIQQAFSETYDLWPLVPPDPSTAGRAMHERGGLAVGSGGSVPIPVPVPPMPAAGPERTPDPLEAYAVPLPSTQPRYPLQPLGSFRPADRPAAYDDFLERFDPVWRRIGRR